jgi:hypothetical protein
LLKVAVLFPLLVTEIASVARYNEGVLEQSLAADGAIASFSSSLFTSAWMLNARRS